VLKAKIENNAKPYSTEWAFFDELRMSGGTCPQDDTLAGGPKGLSLHGGKIECRGGSSDPPERADLKVRPYSESKGEFDARPAKEE
jgi:hypothetical protein